MTTRPSLTRRLVTAHGGRPLRNGIIAALVTTIVMATAGGSYAYWSTSGSATSTPGAASLVVTASSASLNATYGNDTLTSTSYLTVRNDTVTSSAAVPSLSIALGATGDTALASAVSVQAWQVGSPAACNANTGIPLTGVSTGSWNGTTVSGLTLAKTATLTICIRGTIADRTSVVGTTGSRTFTPTATATINVSSFVASGSATGTQSTLYIYSPVSVDRKNWYFIKPQNQTNCLDVSNGDVPATNGTVFISFPCKSTTDTSNYIWNQLWTFLPAGSGYVELKPRSGTNLRVDNNDSPSQTAQLTLKTANPTLGADPSQLWQVQAVGSLYQFVNKATGLCMNVPTAQGQVTQATCSAAATQRFGISSLGPIGLDNVECTIGGNGASRTLSYTWYQNDNGAYSAQVLTGTTWTPLATTNVRAAGVTMTIGNYSASLFGTTYQTRIVDVYGTVVDTGTFVAGNFGWSCT